MSLIRISAAGTVVWAKYLNDPNVESAIQQMEEMPNGDILITAIYRYYQTATSNQDDINNDKGEIKNTGYFVNIYFSRR